MIDEEQKRELAYNISKKWIDARISKMEKDPRWEAAKATPEGLVDYEKRVRWLNETGSSIFDRIINLVDNDEGWALMDEGDILNEVIRPSRLSADEFAQQKAEKARQTQFEPLLAQDDDNRGWYGYDNMQMADVADKLGYNWYNPKDRQEFVGELAKRQLFKDRDKIIKELDNDTFLGAVAPAALPNAVDFTRRSIMSGDGDKLDMAQSTATDFLRALAMWGLTTQTPLPSIGAGIPLALADGAVDAASQAASNYLTDNPYGNSDIDVGRSAGTTIAAATLPLGFKTLSGLAGAGGDSGKRFAEGMGKSIKSATQHENLKQIGNELKSAEKIAQNAGKQKDWFSKNIAEKQNEVIQKKLLLINKMADPSANVPGKAESPVWTAEGKKAAAEIWKKGTSKKWKPERIVSEIFDNLKSHPEYMSKESVDYLEGVYPGITNELARGVATGEETAGLVVGRAAQTLFGIAEPVAGGAGLNFGQIITGKPENILSRRTLPDESKRRRWTIGLETADEKNSEEYKNFIDMLKNRGL